MQVMGIFTCIYCYDTHKAVQAEHAKPGLSAVFDQVLKLDGTLAGEHGIETEKVSSTAMKLIKSHYSA